MTKEQILELAEQNLIIKHHQGKLRGKVFWGNPNQILNFARAIYEEGYDDGCFQATGEVTEMKPYLLIACYHYSCSDPEEWVGFYKTYEEAESKMIKVLKPYTYAMNGKLLFKSFYQYENFGRKDLKCDSYKIVDLREWMNR